MTPPLHDIAGRPLRTSRFGAADAPLVLLVALNAEQERAWERSGRELADAGRHAVVLSLWDEGLDPPMLVAALQSALRQLPGRPAVVAADGGAALALLALGEAEPDLATGFVALARGSADASDPDRLAAAARRLALPALCIGDGGGTCHAAAIAGVEVASLAGANPGSESGAGGDRQEAFDALLVEFLERRVPRAPIEYVAGSDPRTLRDALGTFATGVTVVTATAPDGSHVGLTANSFTSVSLDPPLLLVCPSRSSSSAPVLSQAEFFAVNVLHIGQQPVSTLFATRGVDRFAQAEYEYWERGVPILHNSLATFECRRHAAHDGGDHFILVGEVERARYAPQRDPLLYFRGKYRRLHFA